MRMGKSPTFNEFKSKPSKGIQRCDELLKKSPSDVLLLTTKLRLQCHMSSKDAAMQTLGLLLNVQPPVRDHESIVEIEDAIVELQQETYPLLLTSGPGVSKLWDGAVKSSDANKKLELLSIRFARATEDSRLIDAHQALIQLKAAVPKNRVVYMAHLALTQMLSKTNDDLQARLALVLARKAVTEKFDEDKQLDCRVPGQVFAIQGAEKDLQSIVGRSFADSKHVFRATHPRKEQAPMPTQLSAIDPETTSVRDWLSSEVSSLKEQFRQICLDRTCDEHKVQQIVSNATGAFVLAVESLSLSSGRSAAELIFLATSALVKLWTINRTTAHLLQAAFLTESLLSYQPHVHEAKVFLVYVYTRLGLVSLAAKEWNELAVKGIQLDTVGHIFMTRLSISHPHAFKSKKPRDSEPHRMLDEALNMYERVEQKLSETHCSVLQHGQTGMIPELHDVRDTLRRSVTKRIVSLEQRRLARLTGKALSEQFVQIHPQLVASWLDVKDSRDFTTTFDFGFQTERAVYGEDDMKLWILFGLVTDSAWCLIHGAFPAVKDTPELMNHLDTTTRQGNASDGEFLAGSLSHLILKAVFTIGGENSNGSTLDIATYIDAIRGLQCELLASDDGALPLHARTVCLYLDVLRLTSAFRRFCASKSALTREQANELQVVVDEAVDRLQSYSKKQTSTLTLPEVEQMLDLSAMGIIDILKPLGRDHLTTFAANVVASAKDAWTGAGQIKP